jgi:hypothetical protein
MAISSDDSSHVHPVTHPGDRETMATETVNATVEPSAGLPERSTVNKGHVVSRDRLPADFPTHLHRAQFWEKLGRAVATFGFLEETLAKAIFAFTATRRIPEDQSEAEYEKWLPTLERALTDPLVPILSAVPIVGINSASIPHRRPCPAEDRPPC